MNYFRSLVALILVAATGGPTTLHDSVLTYKQALGECNGALGSVTFSLGHARVISPQGVKSTESAPDANGNMKVMMKDSATSKSASFTIDQTKRQISAKNVKVEAHNQVACILPD